MDAGSMLVHVRVSTLARAIRGARGRRGAGARGFRSCGSRGRAGLHHRIGIPLVDAAVVGELGRPHVPSAIVGLKHVAAPARHMILSVRTVQPEPLLCREEVQLLAPRPQPGRLAHASPRIGVRALAATPVVRRPGGDRRGVCGGSEHAHRRDAPLAAHAGRVCGHGCARATLARAHRRAADATSTSTP